MGTTSGTVAAQAVDVLAGTGMRFAFLHRETEAAAGTLSSDVDLAVEAYSARDVLSRAMRAFGPTELRPVMASEYDTGSVTLWLATPTAEHGVQIDFTYDRSPRNQLALPLGDWVEDAERGDRWPRLPEDISVDYRTRKRALKAGEWSTPRSPSRAMWEAARIGRRVTRPAGFWAGVDDPAVAAGLCGRFAAFLPTTRMTSSPGLDLLRPALLVSKPRPGVHARICDQHTDAAAEALTSAMADRMRRRA